MTVLYKRAVGILSETACTREDSFNTTKIMSQVLKSNNVAGSRKKEPRLVGDIIHEMFLGRSPIARGYREYLASIKNGLEKGGEL